MKKKLLGILVFIMLIATAGFSVVGTVPIGAIENNNAFVVITQAEKSTIHQKGSFNTRYDFIINVIQQINETLYLGYLENITAFGPRVTESTACQQAGDYIYNEFQSMGLEVRYHNWSGWGASDSNIEATLNGTDESSDEIYIICAHHDTVAGSPGADDDGSGVAAVLSAAHVLSQYPFNHTIRFITFSGEEQGMSGSNIYAEEAAANGDHIKAVLNADMIGFATTSEHGKKMKIFEGPNPQPLTDFTINVSEVYYDYIHLDDFIRIDYYLGDDEPFGLIGYPAICYQENEFNYYYHTPGDNISNMNISYALKGTKLILATLAKLAEYSGIGNPPQAPIFSGPNEGIIGQEIDFTIVTTDPDDDDVYYWVDWGDGYNSGWLGPFPSGTLVNVSHIWIKKGEYQIKVKAIDVNYVYSDWSECHTISIIGSEPDLECDGSLSWTDIKPGETVEGNFTLLNNGEPFSLLNWEIESYPEWGTWTITPEEGYDLTPELEPFVVEVSVIAPEKKNSEFTGEVKIVNSENNSDYCTIDVSLATPRNKAFNFNLNLLSWLFERFPNMFPILRHMLGL